MPNIDLDVEQASVLFLEAILEHYDKNEYCKCPICLMLVKWKESEN